MEGDDNYIKEEITMSASSANLKALYLMLPISAITVIPYYLIWKDHLTLERLKAFSENTKTWMGYGTLVAMLVIIIGIVAHELIHGITWARYAKQGFKSIKFGVLWKELTPYCHCSEPLLVRHYLLGAIMPAIVLGIVPTVIAYITGNFWLIAFGLFFTVAAAGDLMMINIIRKENPDDYVQDHPTKIGCFIFRKLRSPD